MEDHIECGKYKVLACFSNDPLKGPAIHPTKTRKGEVDSAKKLYVEDPEVKKMSLAAS